MGKKKPPRYGAVVPLCLVVCALANSNRRTNFRLLIKELWCRQATAMVVGNFAAWRWFGACRWREEKEVCVVEEPQLFLSDSSAKGLEASLHHVNVTIPKPKTPTKSDVKSVLNTYRSKTDMHLNLFSFLEHSNPKNRCLPKSNLNDILPFVSCESFLFQCWYLT